MNSVSIKFKNIKKILFSPIYSLGQWTIIFTVSLAFIFMPQRLPIDWDLNTEGFWSSFPNSYSNPNHVYPPWGLIIMLPYLWIRAEGARVFSVLIIGWLSHRKKWSISNFLSIVLSPFFLVTMAKSNLDIFVLLLPILIWEYSDGKKFQSLGWGMAMSLSLVKPQGMVFIWAYWLWTNRKRLNEFWTPVGILSAITIPISLIGSPPLFLQWLNNILNPSPQNKYFWSLNNLSFTSHLGIIPGVLLILTISLVLYILVRKGWIYWNTNHSYASILFLSFFLMPYTSQQSISSAMAFVPSWASAIIQMIILKTSYYLTDYVRFMPWFVLFFSFLALLLYRPNKNSN